MSKYNLIHFNEIDLDKVEECYEAEVAYDGRIIDIDINFDDDTISKNSKILGKNHRKISKWRTMNIISVN